MTLDKWQSLLKETQVTGGENSCCRREDIGRMESELSLIFPVGYAAFCEVFGSGQLGGFILIFCPYHADFPIDVRKASSHLDFLRRELLCEKERQAKGVPGASKAKIALLERVLSNAFAFGRNPNAHVFLWDLNSYDRSDQSCDIYLVPSDDLEGTTLVGRDFYEFVRNFCLGSKAGELQLNFYEEMTGKTFYRFDEEILKR